MANDNRDNTLNAGLASWREVYSGCPQPNVLVDYGAGISTRTQRIKSHLKCCCLCRADLEDILDLLSSLGLNAVARGKGGHAKRKSQTSDDKKRNTLTRCVPPPI